MADVQQKKHDFEPIHIILETRTEAQMFYSLIDRVDRSGLMTGEAKLLQLFKNAQTSGDADF